MEIKEGYIRVSDILGVWSDFSHIDPEVLANKCRIGTNVHSLIQAHINDIPLEAYSDEEGYFESWMKWASNSAIKFLPEKQELRFYDNLLKITGQIDCIVEIQGKRMLMDWKTSATANKLSWELQAAFYQYLCKANGVDLSDEVWFIQLDKKGGAPKTHIFNISKEVWGEAYACYIAYMRFRGNAQLKKKSVADNVNVDIL